MNAHAALSSIPQAGGAPLATHLQCGLHTLPHKAPTRRTAAIILVSALRLIPLQTPDAFQDSLLTSFEQASSL